MANVGSQMLPMVGKSVVQYEDPSAALNMSEQQWNEAVKQQAIEFRRENERKHQEQIQKNREIYEEQKKQVEAKRAQK